MIEPKPYRLILPLILLGVASAAPCLLAQTTHPANADEVAQLVREGDVAALETRFRGGRTYDELRLLAAAQTNRAARTRGDEPRQAEFENARLRYLAWIASVEHDVDCDRLLRKVRSGTTRLALAEMMLTQWAAPDLDDFEITRGKSGRAARLLELLLQTRDVLNEARLALQPPADELAEADRKRDEDTVERYLIAGVYDMLPRAALNTNYSLAWVNLYIGRIDRENLSRRAEALRTAEQVFQSLTQSEQSGETSLRCRLGLAITNREQARYEDARRAFSQLSQNADDPVLAAQIRVEWASNELRCGRFEEARAVLQPLLGKDADHLPAAEAGARLYVNLAQVWHADSFLLEADYLEKTAGKSAALAELITRARQLRETGLLKMNELATRGGAWPGLVQLYVGEFLDVAAGPEKQDPAVLLFAARRAMSQEQFRDALALLDGALAGKDLKPTLAGDLLFEAGACHYRLDELRPAAEAFTRVVREYPSNPRAGRAVGYAQELWTRLAEESRAPADYSRLADVLFVLVRSFPENELHAEAAWLLPTALQAAGRYREAAEQYGNVPATSPRCAEAKFRRVLCLRLAFEAESAKLPAEQRRAQGLIAARQLEQYAEQAAGDAAKLPTGAGATASPTAAELRGWSAAALVSAAEMYGTEPLNDPERTLTLLDGFEQRYTERGELGRVLAARIAALRGLGRFDEASQAVERFLRDVPADEAGGTLASLARGMQQEVERLEGLGDAAGAKRTAGQSIAIFERLEAWVRAEAGREKYLDAARYGLASMYCTAGRYSEAEGRVRELLEKDARNGDFLRLYALVLSGRAMEAPTPEGLSAAREAWGTILRDTKLRESSPERYGEARYRYLELMLREGRATEVENAIRQERVWRGDGPATTWDGKMDELYEEAKGRMGP